MNFFQKKKRRSKVGLAKTGSNQTTSAGPVWILLPINNLLEKQLNSCFCLKMNVKYG